MSWQVTKKILLVLILVGLTVAAMRLTAIDRTGEQNSFWVWARDKAAPLQQGMWRTARIVNAGAAFVFSWGRETGYSRSLEKKVADLEGQIQRLQAVEQENQRLRALLNYQTTHEKSGIVAAVIGRDPDNWFSTVIINRGKVHGIIRGAVVVSPAGLIGRVLAVSDNTAEVLLITDPRSAVGSTVYETQVPGIVRGALDTTGRLRMQYVVKDETVRKGFAVLTSNLSGVFPPGIPVGKVTGVEEEGSGLFKTVFLKTAVDLSRLDEVLVLAKK
ncbi:MAG: rod shape-determining protein MreC [Bacillota bacterium]